MAGEGAYNSAVFAGGGNRCVWQAGFWRVAAPDLGLKPTVVAAASAGAFMACLLWAQALDKAMEITLAAMAANPSNFYPRRLLRGQQAFPHYAIYRRIILETFGPRELENLRQGPQIRVLMARPPRGVGAIPAVLLGFGAYTLEKRLRQPLHPSYPARLGFRPEIGLAGQAPDAEALADLLMASSCTPPVVPTMYRDGWPVLDGGLVDNVPLLAIEPQEGPTLVLLTRRYDPESLRRGRPGVTYLQPSQPLPVSKWDYTNPQGVRQAYEQGLADGRLFLAQGPQALQR